MGLNAASLHVRIGSGPVAQRRLGAVIRRALATNGYCEARSERAAERTLILHPASSGEWTTVFDSEWMELDAFAARISREAEVETVTSSIRQSDAMRLALFRNGLPVDILASQGPRSVGRPELWGPLLEPGASAVELREALERPAIFAEDKLVALARLLGLNRDLCLADVEDLLDAPGRPIRPRLCFRRLQMATA
ncbi:MAG: hypothetical protein H6509_06055 [Bryobacterales bacterium]|nr:hypothetical protein [Acidobacteriota bacterium]MCB9384158.1 hypothetical protein [Bryobacterales bacterium]